MYTLTFNNDTMSDLQQHITDGRQFYSAIVTPFCGVFTDGAGKIGDDGFKSMDRLGGSDTNIPKIVCPYQPNDVIAIQEKWMKIGNRYIYYDYTNDYNNSGYTFQPASSMPRGAVRLYGRIVSTRVWSITQEIRDNYIHTSESVSECAGVASVIGYADTASRLLSKFRNGRNAEALASTYQKSIPKITPKKIEDQSYMMYQKVNPTLILPGDRQYKTYPDYVLSDIRYEANYYYPVRYDTAIVLASGQPVDAHRGIWYRGAFTREQLNAMDPETYIEVGRASWDADNQGTPLYIAIWPLAPYDNIRYPQARPQTFEAVHTDRTKHYFAWLISGYLSDSQGKIIGSYYGKK